MPICYLQGSIDQRLQVLAGLIDSDGKLTERGYDFLKKIESRKPRKLNIYESGSIFEDLIDSHFEYSK